MFNFGIRAFMKKRIDQKPLPESGVKTKLKHNPITPTFEDSYWKQWKPDADENVFGCGVDGV